MDPTYADLDAVFTLAALVPLAVAAAAWALQMACGFCSVDPPEFWHSVTTVVIIAVTNVVVRFLLQMTGADDGLGARYLAPAAATAAVIALSLPTGPFTATTITVVQVVLCALMYYALAWLAAAAMTPFLM